MNKIANNLNTAVIYTTCTVIILAGIHTAAEIISTGLLAAFFAVACLPALRAMERFKIPHILSVFMVVAGIFIGGGWVISVVGASVVEFSHNLPVYQATVERNLWEWLEKAKEIGVAINPELLKETLHSSELINMVGGVMVGAWGIVAKMFFVVLVMIFILLEIHHLPHKLAHIKSIRGHLPNTGWLNDFIKTVNRYIAVKTYISILTGGAITICLMVIGVDYPFMWGALAAVLNFIPNIGSFIAAVPALVLALIQLGPVQAAWAGAAYLAINLVVGNILEPRLLGREVGLSPLVVLLSLIFWGWMLGAVGMVLSVPLTMIAKFAAETNHKTVWIAVLLGELSEPKKLSPSNP